MKQKNLCRTIVCALALCCFLIHAPFLAYASLSPPSQSSGTGTQTQDPEYDPSVGLPGNMTDDQATDASAGQSPQVASYPYYSPVIYKPEIVLSSYSIAQGSLVAGESVTLRLSFTNTSRTKGVFDLLLTYSTANDTLYTVYGESNTSVVTAIAPGAVYNIEKTFILAKSATEITPLEIDMRYQGVGTGVSNSATIIYLPVFAPHSISPKLDIATTVYANSAMMIGGYCANMGSHGAINLTMRLEGDIENSPHDVALGEIEQGGQVAVQQMVIFPKVGTSQGLNISFSFSDAEGNTISLPSQKYMINVLESPTSDGQFVSEQPTGIFASINSSIGYSFPPMLYILVAILLVVAAILLVLYTRKKRNTKA